MNLTLAGIVTESFFKVLPDTPTAVAPWRNLLRNRLEFPAANAALSQFLTPLASGNYVFDNFPAVNLNGAAILNDLGVGAAFASLFALHLRVAPYRADLATGGDVAVTATNLFGTGAHDCGLLHAGDDFIRTKRAGFALLSTSALQLVVTNPVNLAIEMILIGTETAGVSS